jgi:hypothetical protein
LAGWRARLEAEERRERWRIVGCAATGVGLNGLAVALAVVVVHVAVRLHGDGRADVGEAAIGVGLMVCGPMLLVAAVTKPAGRAERAREVFDAGANQSGSANRAEAVAIVLVMVVALYGSYAIVEAVRRAVMRRRLAGVDPDEVARVMAAVAAATTGVATGSLLKHGQDERSLRGPLAALVLNGWVKIVDGGRSLVAQSPAMRRLVRRHPLADVFQPGE